MDTTILLLLCALTATTALLVWRQQQAIHDLRLDVHEIHALIEEETEAWEYSAAEDADAPSYADSGNYTFTPRGVRYE